MNPVDVASQQYLMTIANLSTRLAQAAIELTAAGEEIASERAKSAALQDRLEQLAPKAVSGG